MFGQVHNSPPLRCFFHPSRSLKGGQCLATGHQRAGESPTELVSGVGGGGEPDRAAAYGTGEQVPICWGKVRKAANGQWKQKVNSERRNGEIRCAMNSLSDYLKDQIERIERHTSWAQKVIHLTRKKFAVRNRFFLFLIWHAPGSPLTAEELTHPGCILCRRLPHSWGGGVAFQGAQIQHHTAKSAWALGSPAPRPGRHRPPVGCGVMPAQAPQSTPRPPFPKVGQIQPVPNWQPTRPTWSRRSRTSGPIWSGRPSASTPSPPCGPPSWKSTSAWKAARACFATFSTRLKENQFWRPLVGLRTPHPL